MQRPPPDDALVARILAEFHEMPGLSVTVAQAARLLGIDEATCQALLTELVERGVLIERHAQYRRETMH